MKKRFQFIIFLILTICLFKNCTTLIFGGLYIPKRYRLNNPEISVNSKIIKPPCKLISNSLYDTVYFEKICRMPGVELIPNAFSNKGGDEGFRVIDTMCSPLSLFVPGNDTLIIAYRNYVGSCCDSRSAATFLAVIGGTAAQTFIVDFFPSMPKFSFRAKSLQRGELRYSIRAESAENKEFLFEITASKIEDWDLKLYMESFKTLAAKY